MRTIRIADTIWLLSALVLIFTIFVSGYTEYLTGWQTFGIFAISFVAVMISEQVSNAYRRQLGLVSLEEEHEASWQASLAA